MRMIPAAALAVALAACPGAWAAQVQVVEVGHEYDYCGTTNHVTFIAGAGEANKLTFGEVSFFVDGLIGYEGPCNYLGEQVAHALVSDTGAWLNVGNRCRLITAHAQAQCSVGGGLDHVRASAIALGDRDDTLALNASVGVGAYVYGESGNDTLRTVNLMRDVVDCGDGTDSVTADRRDELANCESVTRL